MVYQKKVTNLEAGRSPSAQFTVTDMSQVSPSLVSRRLPVSHPIRNRALEVLRKGGFEEPSRSSSMEQLVGGEARSRAPLRVHGQHCPGY